MNANDLLAHLQRQKDDAFALMMSWDARLAAAQDCGDKIGQTATRVPRDHYTDLVIDLTGQINKLKGLING
tara:strand:- start:194 stop:406 length:213 start_codon:yes stop_codon:yes gene_type:complete